MTDNMQRARELLAAEYEKHGRSFTARTILSNPERVGEDFNRALRAIAAALRSAQVPEGTRTFEGTVEDDRGFAIVLLPRKDFVDGSRVRVTLLSLPPRAAPSAEGV